MVSTHHSPLQIHMLVLSVGVVEIGICCSPKILYVVKNYYAISNFSIQECYVYNEMITSQLLFQNLCFFKKINQFTVVLGMCPVIPFVPQVRLTVYNHYFLGYSNNPKKTLFRHPYAFKTFPTSFFFLSFLLN